MKSKSYPKSQTIFCHRCGPCKGLCERTYQHTRWSLSRHGLRVKLGKTLTRDDGECEGCIRVRSLRAIVGIFSLLTDLSIIDSEEYLSSLEDKRVVVRPVLSNDAADAVIATVVKYYFKYDHFKKLLVGRK